MSDSKKNNYKKIFEQILKFLEKEYPEPLPKKDLSSEPKIFFEDSPSIMMASLCDTTKSFEPISLSKSDEIWKKICQELDWKFVSCDEKNKYQI